MISFIPKNAIVFIVKIINTKFPYSSNIHVIIYLNVRRVGIRIDFSKTYIDNSIRIHTFVPYDRNELFRITIFSS